VPETSAFGFELGIEKLRSHKSPGIDQLPSEQFKAGYRNFAMRSIKLLLLFRIRRNSRRRGRSRSLYLSIRKETKYILILIGTYPSYQPLTKF
jgi:hypothetical protein